MTSALQRLGGNVDSQRMDESLAPVPIDPAAAPRSLVRLAAGAALAGSLMLIVGAAAATRTDGRSVVSPELFLYLWLLSLPVAALLLLAHRVVGRRRLHRYERRFGFLPRAGRRAMPSSGRTTLVRVEYGSRDDRVCLMVTRWAYGGEGWQRGRILDLAWVGADDPVALGEQRARLTARAEALEEEFDDARLAGDGYRELEDEQVAERRSADEGARRLARSLARDERR